ncbi:ubiquitin carboxyl-terminal hydrolase 36-like isoform X1 [Phaenicophaeus curvirostris]|uniref:ubiquitin carboxyl-terminal hydrolase 36-like isoform X1 n=1 Tax=Phaenicophaeus curvirostris TaxID=33595 RepID=UPI0037F0DF35
MLCAMENHVIQVFGGSGSIIQPMSFIRDIKKIAQHIRFGRQEDAHEFLRFVVDAMQRACLNGCTQLDHQTETATLVHQIFGGYLRSRVKCKACSLASDAYEPFLDLVVEIEEVESIQQALNLFVRPETLCEENAYLCDKCKTKVPVIKCLSIHRASNVLTLSLKRFSIFTGGKITKVSTWHSRARAVPWPEALLPRAGWEVHGVSHAAALLQPCSGSSAHPRVLLTVTSAWGEHVLLSQDMRLREQLSSCSSKKAVCCAGF